MLIDSHHHLWRYDPAEYPWIDNSMGVLKQDFLAAELRDVSAAADLNGCVAVQARQSLVENDFLLSIADALPLIRGVVGWVPLAEPNVGEALQQYASHPKFVGVRHVIQDEPDDGFILNAEFNQGVAELLSFDLTYDILIYARHLSATIEFVDRHPEQPMVLDHIAKPAIGEEFDHRWEVGIRELAKRDNVVCKFSGVVTEVRLADWSVDTIRRYWEVALEAFSPSRLMFGSDWPVCLLATDYPRWVATVVQLVDTLSATERNELLAQTALRTYNLQQ